MKKLTNFVPSTQKDAVEILAILSVMVLLLLLSGCSTFSNPNDPSKLLVTYTGEQLNAFNEALSHPECQALQWPMTNYGQLRCILNPHRMECN